MITAFAKRQFAAGSPFIMKTSLALAMASVMRMACANMELIPRQLNVQEPAAEFAALCPTCCTNTILRTTIKETFL